MLSRCEAQRKKNDALQCVWFITEKLRILLVIKKYHKKER